MTSRDRYRPFTGDAARRLRFESNPLALVLCQVRWPNLAAFQMDFDVKAKSFGALLQGFPLFSEHEEMSLGFSPDGVNHSQVSIYQWSSVDRAWNVSLGPTFVTLSTTDYSNYEAFSEKLHQLLVALSEVFDLPLIERVGMRYVNVIDDSQQIANVDSLVRPEILGYHALSLDESEVVLKQSLNQALFQVGEGLLQTRTGLIPAGEVLDPALGAYDSPTWVLDIDAFLEGEKLFDPQDVLSQTGTLSDSAYDFFKFVIESGFMEIFGGREI